MCGPFQTFHVLKHGSRHSGIIDILKNSKLKKPVKKYSISLRFTHHTTMLRYYEKYYFHPLPPAFMHTAISRSTNYKFKFMTRNKKDEIGRRG